VVHGITIRTIYLMARNKIKTKLANCGHLSKTYSMNDFKNVLRETIDSLKLANESSRAAADRLGYSRQKIDKWLDGTSVPSKPALNEFMKTIALSPQRMVELEFHREAAKGRRKRVRRTNGMLKNERVYSQFIKNYDMVIDGRYDDTFSFQFYYQPDDAETIAVMGFCAETVADVFFRAQHSIWANNLPSPGQYRVLVVVDDVDTSPYEEFLSSESIATISEGKLNDKLEYVMNTINITDNVVETVNVVN